MQHAKKRMNILILVTFLALLPLLFALPVFAQNYVSLSGIPQIEGNANNRDLSGLLKAIYLIVVSVGSLLAVIKIAIAGVKYSMSEVVTSKQDAKNDIIGALFGLAILLLPYVVLSTIYPGLVNLDILRNVSPAVNTNPSQVSTDSQIRQQIVQENPYVESTATVKGSTKEHLDFIKECNQVYAGKVVMVSKSGTTYTLECRSSGSDDPF